MLEFLNDIPSIIVSMLIRFFKSGRVTYTFLMVQLRKTQSHSMFVEIFIFRYNELR